MKKLIKMNDLTNLFSVAPMMDWTDTPIGRIDMDATTLIKRGGVGAYIVSAKSMRNPTDTR